MIVLKLKEGVSLPRVRPAMLFSSHFILASQRVVEEMSVIVFPVRVAGQAKQPWNRKNHYRGAIEWVDVPVDVSHRVSYNCPQTEKQDCYE